MDDQDAHSVLVAMRAARADLVDRPATRRRFLLVKREGSMAQTDDELEADLQKEIESLLEAEDWAGAFRSLIERLNKEELPEGAKASVAELQTLLNSLEEQRRKRGDYAYYEPPEGRRKRLAQSVVTKMASWITSHLRGPEGDAMTDQTTDGEKKEEAAAVPAAAHKSEETSAPPSGLSLDELRAAINVAVSPIAGQLTDLAKAIEGVPGLTQRVEAIESARGIRKSQDGQEKEPEPETKPLKKDFGAGMFDNVLSSARAQYVAGKLIRDNEEV